MPMVSQEFVFGIGEEIGKRERRKGKKIRKGKER
jgi:hypothetical protein